MVEFWSKALLMSNLNPYKPDTILFESSSPGTYTLNPKGDGVYEVYCIAPGAGGNGGAMANNKYATGGGGGSGFIGELLLNKQPLTIVIGVPGAARANGGQNKIGDIIIANGGIAPPNMMGTGYGGAITVNNKFIVGTPSLCRNGNNGLHSTSSSYYGGAASLYNGFGKGGNGHSRSPQAGGSGYVKIVYKRLKP